MQFGLIVQTTGPLGDARPLVQLAREAEAAGWDGFFIWDVFGGDAADPSPVADPWITLAAIAASTERIRFGTLVTPLPRRRPWKVAREAATLDQLSNGRLILGVGIGTPPEEFARFGEEPDAKTRAAMLDEGLEVLTGLWSGEPFTHHGQHYHVDNALVLPTPVQRPRVPIWVGAGWPRKPGFRRAAKWDGVHAFGSSDNLPLEDLRRVRDFIQAERDALGVSAPFDIVTGGDIPYDDPAAARAVLADYAAAGVTWWLEGVGSWLGPLPAMTDFIRRGPPGR